MGVPTKQELEQALGEAVQMREHGEDKSTASLAVIEENRELYKEYSEANTIRQVEQ